MSRNIIDPYVEVEAAEGTCPAEPTEQSTRVTFRVPKPDNTFLSMGAAGSVASQAGIIGETNSHIHLRAAGNNTVVSLGNPPDVDGAVCAPDAGYQMQTDGNKTEDIGAAVKEHYKDTHSRTVKGAATFTFDNSLRLVIDKGRERKVVGAFRDEIHGGRTQTIGGGDAEVFEAGRTVSVWNNFTHNVGSSGFVEHVTTGTYTLTAARGIKIKSDQSIALHATAASIINAPATYEEITGIKKKKKWLFDSSVEARKSDAYVNRISVVPLKFEVVGSSLSLYLSKIEQNVVKLDVTGTKLESNVDKLKMSGSDVRMAGIAQCVFAIISFL